MRTKTNLPRVLGGGIAALLLVAMGWGYTFIINDQVPKPSGTGLPIKWAAGSIPVRILADNTTALSGDNLTRATSIQAAMTDATRGWNQYLGNVQFAPTIRPVASGGDDNGVNEIFFSDKPYDKTWDTNTLAVTTVWFMGNDRAEGDIIFNTAYTWDSYRGSSRAVSGVGPYDIQRVALHELGHVLGLDHPDEATPPQTVTAMMNSHVSSLDSLATDDISGAQKLYGPPGIPANDNFANATVITLTNGAATVTGYNTNATKETGEPNHAGDAGGHSVWWKWTALSAGTVTLDTKGSYCDTTLAVYTGTAVASLTAIASNDDITPGVVQASSLTFTATLGTTYYFAADGFGGDASGLTLNLAFASTGPSLATITTQPTSTTVTAGNSASFSVVASAGTSTITYQWYLGATAISGATSATLSLTSVQSSSAGSYYVNVITDAGVVKSDTVTLTVNAAPVVTPPPASSGGGGGGGAPSLWFCGALSLLGLGRRLLRPRGRAA